jgi:transcriptional regulator with XRE-family HTH domain
VADMEIKDNSIKTILKIIRVYNSERLKDMASKLKISIPYLSSIENGKRNIPKWFLERMNKNYILEDETKEKLAREFIKEAYIKNTRELQKTLGISWDIEASFQEAFEKSFKNDWRSLFKEVKE